jgi:hypothetical protein
MQRVPQCQARSAAKCLRTGAWHKLQPRTSLRAAGQNCGQFLQAGVMTDQQELFYIVQRFADDSQ